MYRSFNAHIEACQLLRTCHLPLAVDMFHAQIYAVSVLPMHHPHVTLASTLSYSNFGGGNEYVLKRLGVLETHRLCL